MLQSGLYSDRRLYALILGELPSPGRAALLHVGRRAEDKLITVDWVMRM